MKRMHIATLRKVSKPGARRGQARWVPGDPRDRNPHAIANDRLSGLVAYTVIPRLERGQAVEVRWTIAGGFWSDWVSVIP